MILERCKCNIRRFDTVPRESLSDFSGQSKRTQADRKNTERKWKKKGAEKPFESAFQCVYKDSLGSSVAEIPEKCPGFRGIRIRTDFQLTP